MGLAAVLRLLEEDADGLDGVFCRHAAAVEHDDVARHPAIRLLAEHGADRPEREGELAVKRSGGLDRVLRRSVHGTLLVLLDRVLRAGLLRRGLLRRTLALLLGLFLFFDDEFLLLLLLLGLGPAQIISPGDDVDGVTLHDGRRARTRTPSRTRCRRRSGRRRTWVGTRGSRGSGATPWFLWPVFVV